MMNFVLAFCLVLFWRAADIEICAGENGGGRRKGR